ncbi:DNA polymerase Y family protein [Bremerella cremea]|uniref:Y-family DNA polymerase n=1 Tax=Bremerella cremea TaxID=1031537 RepID=UPI0031EC2FD9
MKRILAVWLPNWPIQRWQASEPEQRDRVQVLSQVERRGQCVVACCDRGYQMGIRPGMPVAEVNTLLQARGLSATEAMTHRPYDPAADREALEKLARWACRFSPCVDVEQREPADTLLLDASGLAPLFGGEDSLLCQVQQGFARIGLKSSLALAGNIGTAWGLAHHPPAELAQRDGTGRTLVSSDTEQESLVRQLPIEALRIPATLIETLHLLGLYHVGQLMQVPRGELKARLGMEPLVRLDQVLGHKTEVMQAARLPQQFAAQWILEHPTDHPESIHTMVMRLLSQLLQQLAAHDLGALKLTCVLQTANRRETSFEVGLFRPSSCNKHLRGLVDTQFERIRIPGPIQEVTMQVVQFARLEKRQQSLFQEMSWKDSSAPPDHSQEISGLVDRLASRLGRDAVVRPRLVADAQPELAFSHTPLVGQPPRRTTRRSEFGPLERPWQLQSSPTPIDVTAVMPDGPPIQFRWQGEHHQVERHWGPERIETGWWRRRAVRRDYYRVETTTGHRFWIFRELTRQNWYLHGSFD